MDEKIKVTDKRMFTPDGQLREQPEQQAETEPDESVSAEPSGRKVSEPVSFGESGPGTDAGSERSQPEAPSDSAPRAPAGELPAPSFLDLVGLLAQPVAMFLGDAKLPGGESEENLPLARYHIDLLELLEAKTKGNIGSDEAKLLEDLLYQLRMRYVEKAG